MLLLSALFAQLSLVAFFAEISLLAYTAHLATIFLLEVAYPVHRFLTALIAQILQSVLPVYLDLL